MPAVFNVSHFPLGCFNVTVLKLRLCIICLAVETFYLVKTCIFSSYTAYCGSMQKSFKFTCGFVIIVIYGCDKRQKYFYAIPKTTIHTTIEVFSGE